MKLTYQQLEQAKLLWYSNEVRKYTEKTLKKEFLKDSNLRGQDFSVDHKLSIKECYDNDIPIFIAGHECNLEIITKMDNLIKGSKSSITPEELWEEYNQRENDLLY